MKKCKVFTDWCEAEGIIYPKCEYPAFFEGGILGVRATEEIKHREMICSVPFKCIITLDKALADPVLS